MKQKYKFSQNQFPIRSSFSFQPQIVTTMSKYYLFSEFLFHIARREKIMNVLISGKKFERKRTWKIRYIYVFQVLVFLGYSSFFNSLVKCINTAHLRYYEMDGH